MQPWCILRSLTLCMRADRPGLCDHCESAHSVIRWLRMHLGVVAILSDGGEYKL